MVIPYYCEDYPEAPDDFETANDAASSLHPKTSPNDAASRLEPTPAEIFAWNPDGNGNAVIVELRDKTARSVVVPQTLEGRPVVEIGKRAFQNAEHLTQLVLPTSLKRIGASAFANCAALKEISFPASLEEISAAAFAHCLSLKKVFFNDAASAPNSIETHKFIVRDFPGRAGFHYSARRLLCRHKLNLPVKFELDAQHLLMIDNYAFYNCSSLMRVHLSNTVAEFGGAAFSSCASLERITVSPQNPHFKDLNGVLYTKDLETLVAYPAALASSNYAPYPKTKTIFSGAFTGCKHLRQIILPPNVTLIFNGVWDQERFPHFSGPPCFVDCPNLLAIQVASENTHYRDDDGVLLTRDGATLKRCPEGKTGKYVVPDGVEYISSHAFYNCSKLTEILLPSTLKRIGEDAFAGCSSLSQIVLPNGLEKVSQYAFAGCASLTQVVVPPSVKILDENAFANCPRLEPPELPDGVFYSHIIYD